MLQSVALNVEIYLLMPPVCKKLALSTGINPVFTCGSSDSGSAMCCMLSLMAPMVCTSNLLPASVNGDSSSFWTMGARTSAYTCRLRAHIHTMWSAQSQFERSRFQQYCLCIVQVRYNL